MRVATQIAVVAVIGGGIALGYMFRTGQLPGQVAGAPPAQQAAGGNRPAGGSPGGGPAGSRGGQGAPLVEVVTLTTGPIIETSEAVGTTRAYESVTIASKVSGIVEKITFTEGQDVKAGDVLIELDVAERRAELEAARAAIQTARAQREEVNLKFERAQQLRRAGAGTEALVADLTLQLRTVETTVAAAEARERAAAARLEDYIVRAPFDGRVGLRQVSLGAFVDTKIAITTLDDVGRIRLDFAIPEPLLSRVRVGAEINAQSIAFQGRVFRGTVAAIDTRIDPVTRSVKLMAVIENSDLALKPGMFMTVALEVARRDNAVIAPEEAIVAEGPRQVAYVVKDNRVERRVVMIGQRSFGKVEIIEGLKAGETIVARGIQRVRHGIVVQPRPLSGPPAAGAAPNAARVPSAG
ncbi:MAG: efflux RND transporter periplasmic adaptor subunit [Methylobacterium sp.]|nr:efflux RND transporter periplasmic adaptor subunit [Methylobacterium sp.]MCA3607156.1 efflux RND transporter periplasmic adaptor subunit [Methylobacterium sp.]MCA3608519.1 efflux RND transporter periplasmic adaptor subunit [Methylobacterium sp.]MCA3617480.1 efflux RND transporter periplasmic adaptor subunit [Methylobacterium sp.]MCA3620585.1 efflux RND transporter periplasmic adaptor subunit [Methylobacterium sp.]